MEKTQSDYRVARIKAESLVKYHIRDMLLAEVETLAKVAALIAEGKISISRLNPILEEFQD